MPNAEAAPPHADVPHQVWDGLLALAVAIVIAGMIALGSSDPMVSGDRPADAWAYLFAAGFGVLLLLRRQAPAVMLAATVIGIFAYYILGYPPIGVAVPVVAALFAAADAGRVWQAALAGGMVLATSTYFRVTDGESLAFLLGYEGMANLALIAAGIGLGIGTRATRVQRRQQAENTRLVREQTRREAALRLSTERERLSRDLHDTVGHAMSVVSLQAAVAAEALGRDDATAADALSHIRATSGRALGEVRALVRSLRDSATLEAPLTLGALEGLVAEVRATGLEVSMEVEVAGGNLSAPVEAAVVRIVQESLTNVVRHAEASRASVQVMLEDGEGLRVRVADDGRGSDERRDPDQDAPSAAESVDRMDTGSAHGLAGMRERARLLGGQLSAGTAEACGGGFVVEAVLPVRSRE